MTYELYEDANKVYAALCLVIEVIFDVVPTQIGWHYSLDIAIYSFRG